MPIVQLEHPVPDYDAWKRAFDSDPLHREKSGVKRYRILRPVDDPRYVLVDLEFGTLAEAETFQEALRGLWRRVEGTVMERPRVRIVESSESKEY